MRAAGVFDTEAQLMGFCHGFATVVDCAPKLRQSEFGHSSANGERDVRRGETKMGPSVGRIPTAGFGADENMPERKGTGERARSGAAAVVLVEAAGRKTTEAE